MADDSIGGYAEVTVAGVEKTKLLPGLTIAQSVIILLFNVFIGIGLMVIIFPLNGYAAFFSFLTMNILGFALMFGGLEWLLKWFAFRLSIEKADLFSPEMENIVNIENIEKRLVEYKDGTFGYIIRVKPINFLTKSKEDKEGIMYGYRQLLESSVLPIKPITRTIKLSLDSYIRELKNSWRKPKNPIEIAHNANFEEFWKKYTTGEDKVIHNRLFYVSVRTKKDPWDVFTPMFEKMSKLMDSFANKFFGMKMNSTKLLTEKQKNLQKRELDNYTKFLLEKLINIGLLSRAMEKPEITSFYSNVFNSLEERNEDYGSSLILPDSEDFEK